jgi:hypothetical protein
MSTSSKSLPTVKVIGSNGQISLGKKFAGRQVVVEEREPGVWLVRTATVVPDNESWLTEEEIRKMQRALARSMATPPRETDLDALTKRLNEAD